MKFIINIIRITLMKSTILVGGQAVIEGVMMRVPGAYSTAVRDSNGKIHVKRLNFTSFIEKHPRTNIPFIRGIFGLFESLKIGYSTLEWSANIASNESLDNKKIHNKIIDVLLTIFSFLVAILLFFAGPMSLTSWLFNKDQDPFIFNLISGLFRICFFILYLLCISLMSDIKRLFQYHGAEHKTVYNFESGLNLNIINAQSFPTQHPRCGTSFMFIIMIVAILSFAFLDSLIMLYVNKLTITLRLILHLPFIPIISGIGYEILKITAKYKNNFFFQLLSQPGLWLQNITTKEPDSNQLEVALTALKSAFGDKLSKYTKGEKYVAEAIG